MTKLNQLSLRNMFILCFIFGLGASVYAYFSKHPFIKPQEQKLNIYQTLKLYAVRTFHYSVSFYARFYQFLVEIAFLHDIYYLLFFIVISIHWKVFSECYLSIIEKQILEPDYIGGDDPSYEPFFKLLHDSKFFYDCIQYLAYFALIIVVLRIIVYMNISRIKFGRFALSK